ncbi:hypothetical protein D3C75_981490 [compost metagenome]
MGDDLLGVPAHGLAHGGQLHNADTSVGRVVYQLEHAALHQRVDGRVHGLSGQAQAAGDVGGPHDFHLDVHHHHRLGPGQMGPARFAQAHLQALVEPLETGQQGHDQIVGIEDHVETPKPTLCRCCARRAKRNLVAQIAQGWCAAAYRVRAISNFMTSEAPPWIVSMRASLYSWAIGYSFM